MTFRSALAKHARESERAGKKEREHEKLWRKTQLPAHKSHNALLLDVIKYFMIAPKAAAKSMFVRLNPICSSMHTTFANYEYNKCAKNMQFILFFGTQNALQSISARHANKWSVLIRKAPGTEPTRSRAPFSPSRTNFFHTFIPHGIRAYFSRARVKVCAHFRRTLCAKAKHVDGSMPCCLKIKITYDVYFYCLQSIFTSLCCFRAALTALRKLQSCVSVGTKRFRHFVCDMDNLQHCTQPHTNCGNELLQRETMHFLKVDARWCFIGSN